MDFKKELETYGFSILRSIYTEVETKKLLACIEEANSSNTTFRKSSGDLFAIRQFIKEIPDVAEILFNQQLRSMLDLLFDRRYFLVKGIYFDKPPQSNWFVSYHQDLTISVDKKLLLEGFGPWTVKQNQFAVQPPLDVLENVVTVRIHLDDTDEENGALKVIPASHRKGIYRPENIDWTIETETNCSVPAGGIMLMKPLLLHSSGRTTNERRRRVIHLEFSDKLLPAPLNWSEKVEFV